MDASTTAPSTRSTLGRQPLELEPPVPDTLLLQEQLNAWEDSYHSDGFDAVALLGRIAEILERAMEDFLHLNPDPLDDRHPLRTHPNASFGIMLKAIIRKEIFMQTLIVSYLMARDNVPLAEAAARVLLSCVPALDSDSIFSDPEELIPCLYKYASNGGSDGLKAYSFGLLASAMEVQDNAGKYRKENGELIPIALRELQRMRDEMERAASREHEDSNSNGEMAVDSRAESPAATFPAAPQENGTTISIENLVPESSLRVRKRTANGSEEKPAERGGGPESPPRKKRKSVLRPLSPPNSADESSVSQWNVIKHVLIGTHKIYPLTMKMHQRLIIQYLGSIGEYQDMLVLAYEGNSMSLLFDYISMEFTDDVRLTFDALKYLCSLLVHRKFALEFVSKEGVHKLLKVPCTSLAGVGVATCFYYLSYGVDVMERVCQLEEKVIDQVVEYMLWVQEHSHESGMASATMFFTHALAFRAILDRFDARDGLRKLYNYMQTSTQTIRNTCGALKTYATSHLFMRVEQYRRMNVAREGAREKTMGDAARSSQPTVTPRHGVIATTSQPPANIPYYKPMHMEEETLRQAVWMLAGLQKAHYSGWKAMESLRSIGLLRLLLTMVLKAHAWVTVSAGKIEIAVNTMTTIMVAATIPRVQADLCAPVSADVPVTGLSVIFTLCDEERADGDDPSTPPHKLYGDAEAPIAALCVFVACLAPPIEQEGGRKLSVARKLHGGSGGGGGAAHSSGSKHGLQPAAELFKKMVETIRSSNGLMALNKLIRSKTPITAADEIRFLTCKVLVALARDPEVRRILLLLPLISQNELHDVMNEPACPDRKAVHAQFCAEARALIATVTEKSLKDVKKDLTQERLWKSHIISSTQIAYNERELLQLIHDHLVSKGLSTAAAALSTEADLAGQQPLAAAAAASNGLATNGTGAAGATAATISSAAKALEGLNMKVYAHSRSGRNWGIRCHRLVDIREEFLEHRGCKMAVEVFFCDNNVLVGRFHFHFEMLIVHVLMFHLSSPSSHLRKLRLETVDPSRNILTRPPSPSRRMASLPTAGLRYAPTPGGRPRKTRDGGSTPFPRRLPIRPSGPRVKGVNERVVAKPPSMELTDIVTEYFRVQHSNCANPVSTCPPFSLFHPHRCPEPAPWRRVPQNVTARSLESGMYSHRSRMSKKTLDERFIFSRFRPSKTFNEAEEHYTACSFSIDDEHLIVGTFSGEVQWMNIETGLCEATAQCHHSAISDIIPSKDGSMVLTSGMFMQPQSTLWRLGDQQTHYMDFPDDTAVQFNNGPVQNMIVGTSIGKATVYDVETSCTRRKLQNVDKNGQFYNYSKAMFSPCDEMILYDNTLYDIRAADPVVRSFDRMNQASTNNGGCFHPHGNEIIINTEVWDMRSFRLLHSVPALDQCRLQFNATGNIILAGQYSPLNDPYKTQFASTLRTMSSSDYSVISTLDTRKALLDFCFSHADTDLAVVEIGKVRVAEDGDEDGEQDEPDMDGDGGDSSDSSSDEDSEDSGSEDSEGALDMLGRMAGGSEGEDDENDEEESSDEEDGEDGDGSSSGWETASNQEDGGAGEEVNDGEESGEDEDEDNEDEDEAEGSDISIFMDDGSDEEDDQDDPAFNPDVDERGGTSNIILNPNLRRRRGM
ncbi:dcaf-1 [Pristionchus pacificus]|uniref:Dcaf-1 n=1 Tax=Pristionchus pacificus TaxID=54126 RepID=A0A2A6BHP2_PRIPA|nr:dcaf-1 [Pristionchus pacificus]|eukprot:PDM65412.1 dcaf-1 [Pristionchus pacificus]